MIPLIPVAIVGLAGLAWHRAKSKKMTPERKLIFETAMLQLKDPDKLMKLADAFDEAGLKDEAELLRKRAVMRNLPDDVKQARKDALKKGLSSKDPAAVNSLADAFEKEGYTANAKLLRDYAKGLSAVTK